MTDPDHADYPPLTEQEFADGCDETRHGIPFGEDEDARFVYAWGHRDRDLFAAAVNEYDTDMGAGAPPGQGYTATDVRHVWAVTVKPPDDPDGWWVSWHRNDPDAPGAFGMTVINR